MTPINKFWLLLDRTFPGIGACWDRKNQTLKFDRFAGFIGSASSGEYHMALFCRAVWEGQALPEAPFDLVRAIAAVDPSQAALIREWVAEPFWP